jgi:two-component system, cell cycle sensor histidine kinase and response regulator CckA
MTLNRVLVVDNNEENLYFLLVLLQGHGYTVDSAINGADALDMARKNPPDLIISDILMPVMDGFTLCREWMKDERLKIIPFVFYTATYTDERDREFALSLGAERFIIKPEEPAAFMAIIQEILRNIEVSTDARSKAAVKVQIEASQEEESVFLKQYNETLIRKLEKKMEQLIQTNRRLEQDIAGRQMVEKALRESENRFSTVFNKSPLSIAITRLKDNCFLDVNEAFLKLTGLTREETIGHTPHELNIWFDPDERDHIISQLRETGTVNGSEMKLQRKSGETSYLLFSADLIDLEGEACMLSMAQDITKRVAIEEALRESEERYRIIATNTADVITVTDMDLRTIFISPSIERLRGFTVEEAMNQTFEQIMTPESFKLTHKLTEEEKEFEASGTVDPERTRTIEVEEYKKDGSTVWVETTTSFLRDKDGKAIGILAVTRDIAERKRAEGEHERLMAAIEQSGETILITDATGTLLYVNPAFEKTTGYSREEAIGKTPRLFTSGEHTDAFYHDLWATISSGKNWHGRMINRRKDGTCFTEAVTISPVCDAAGHIINYVAIKRDITEHLRLEAQFMQAQKMEAVGVLAGGVAHDFNNLLTVIKGYAELLAENLTPNDPKRRDLEQIIKAGQQAASLTTQLLAFSRKQMLQPKRMNLNEVLTEAEKMLRRLIGEDIKFTVTAHPDLGLIFSDPGQVQQILMNLAVNARDAMPKGGSLTIETSNAYFDEDYFDTHPIVKTGSYVMLAVSDTGIGMDAKTQAHIFEPFFTTKERGKGTGLGLSTVYGIVKQSDGFIWVYSEPEKGTTFKIYFPRVEGDIQAVSLEKKGKSVFRGSETILVVEDEEAVRALSCRILRDRGYNIFEAANGIEALRIAKNYEKEIHLAITDVIMPVMGGKDFASKLNVIRPGIKVLYVSGYADTMIEYHGLLDSNIAFLQKPFTVESLARKVREVIDS